MRIEGYCFYNKTKLFFLFTFLLSLICMWIVVPFFRGVLPSIVNMAAFTILSFALFLVSFLIKPNWLSVAKLRICFGFMIYLVVSLFCMLIGRGERNINPLINFLFVPFFVLISLFVRENVPKKYVYSILFITFIFLSFTLVTTCNVLIKDGYASRYLTSSSVDESTRRYYESKNVASFDLIYGSIILIPFTPLLNNRFKSGVQKFIVGLFSLFVLILIVISVLLSHFLTAYFACSIALVLFFFNYRRFKSFVFLFLIVFVFVLLTSSNILLDFLSFLSRLSGNHLIYMKTSSLEDAIKGNIGFFESSDRFELFKLSLNSFLDNPIFGHGAYYTVSNGIVGCHSSLVDDLARFGVIVGLLVFVSYFRFYKVFYVKTKIKYEVFCAAVLYLFFLVTNPVYNYGTMLSFFLIIPLFSYCNDSRKVLSINENFVLA